MYRQGTDFTLQFIGNTLFKGNTPIYIRGIGSKTNAPSVGLYVDGMPYFDRSVVDLELAGISGIEVLRGPQGTLYGRNSTGGLINIYTYSPLDYQNTIAKISYGSRNDVRLGVAHYQKIASRLGLHVAGNYHHNDGFFRNLYTGKKADNLQDANAKIGLAWQAAPLWTMRLNVLFDHSTQGGYPYGVYHANDNTADAVNYNRNSDYRRNVLSAGMNWLYRGNAFRFNAQTSFQHSNDKQHIDQDFTPQDLFFVTTQLKQTLVSQEFTLRSADTQGRYHWIVGAFGFYQKANNSVETQFITRSLATPKYYNNPTWAAALYHQSTYDLTKSTHIAVGGLSRLTEALTQSVGESNIILGAKEVVVTPMNGQWQVSYKTATGETISLCSQHVITTVGAYALKTMLPFVEEADMAAISALRYAPIIQVSVGLSDAHGVENKAFGGLIPTCEKQPFLGILFPSACFSQRCPTAGALYSFFIGGTNHIEMFDKTDAELQQMVCKGLTTMLGLPANVQPDMIRIFRHERAIPQYELSSGARFEAVNRIEQAYKGLIIGGNLRDGIGMADRIRQAVRMGLQLA